jgi:hypothetical protein
VWRRADRGADHAITVAHGGEIRRTITHVRVGGQARADAQHQIVLRLASCQEWACRGEEIVDRAESFEPHRSMIGRM